MKNERPFLSHLEELRKRLILSSIFVVIGIIICSFFSNNIFQFLKKPYKQKLIFISPSEAFFVYLKVVIISGIILALPFISYELWSFVKAALKKKEREIIIFYFPFSIVLFFAGVGFFYFIALKFSLRFLLGFGKEVFKPMISANSYISFVSMLMLIFGILFELPLVSFSLTKLGIISPDFLKRKRKSAIVIIFVCAAILTPPDVYTQFLLAGPLILLYEITIIVSKIALLGRKYRN